MGSYTYDGATHFVLCPMSNVAITTFLALFSLFGCDMPEYRHFGQPIHRDWPIDSLLPLHPGPKDYTVFRAEINQTRLALANAYKRREITLDSVRRYFTAALVNGIIPYWYHTPWSFEGHTDKPLQGTIACGYFVSTTLLHAGVNLNRYKLAQQSPENEAKMIAMTNAVQVLRSNNPDSTALRLNTTLRDGLYFVGLGMGHVGYLFKKNGQLIAIHANYLPPKASVQAQTFAASVYTGFDTYYLADITWNDALVEAWLGGVGVR